jgi:hypothetical protein
MNEDSNGYKIGIDCNLRICQNYSLILFIIIYNYYKMSIKISSFFRYQMKSPLLKTCFLVIVFQSYRTLEEDITESQIVPFAQYCRLRLIFVQTTNQFI